MLQLPARSNAWTQNLSEPDALGGTRQRTYASSPTARTKPVLATPIWTDLRQIVNHTRASRLSSETEKRSFALLGVRALLGTAPTVGRR